MLERKLRIGTASDRSWSLHEVDDKGVKIKDDWVPFTGFLAFTAKNIEVITILSAYTDYTELKSRIVGTLISGAFGDCGLENQVNYSLFGSSARITKFSLRINKVDEGKNECCTLYAIPAIPYDDVCIGLEELCEDNVEFDVYISSDKLNALITLIEKKTLANVTLLIYGIDGIYSPTWTTWDPVGLTSSAKILSRGCEVENGDEFKDKIPYVGKVKKFELSFSSKIELMH